MPPLNTCPFRHHSLLFALALGNPPVEPHEPDLVGPVVSTAVGTAVPSGGLADDPLLHVSEGRAGALAFTEPVGGRLSAFLHQWRRVTRDSFILSIVAYGLIIDTSPAFPGVMRSVTRVPRDNSARLTIVEELNSLLHKNAILQIARTVPIYVCPLFSRSQIAPVAFG